MPTLSPKNESEFQSLFNKFYRGMGYWVYKIRDVGGDIKPFDCLLFTNKNKFAIELKYERRKTMLDVTTLMLPHQIRNLGDIEKLHRGTSFVVTYHRERKKIFIHSISNLDTALREGNYFPEDFF